jgi:hypothetical protein
MAKGIPSSFGDVRSLLHERPVQPLAWYRLSKALGFFDKPETLRGEVLPYCAEAIREWPRDLRRDAPNEWVFGRDGRERHEIHPCLALATHVETRDLLSEDGAARLLDALGFELVEHLEITNMKTPEAVFETLLDANIWGALRSFRYNAPLSGGMLRRFFSSEWCVKLQRIDLGQTGFDDDVMAFVAEQDNFDELEWLCLGDNNITRAGIEHLLTMKSLGNLDVLELGGNAFSITDGDVFTTTDAASLRFSVLALAWEEYYGEVFE